MDPTLHQQSGIIYLLTVEDPDLLSIHLEVLLKVLPPLNLQIGVLKHHPTIHEGGAYELLEYFI